MHLVRRGCGRATKRSPKNLVFCPRGASNAHAVPCTPENCLNVHAKIATSSTMQSWHCRRSGHQPKHLPSTESVPTTSTIELGRSPEPLTLFLECLTITSAPFWCCFNCASNVRTRKKRHVENPIPITGNERHHSVGANLCDGAEPLAGWRRNRDGEQSRACHLGALRAAARRLESEVLRDFVHPLQHHAAITLRHAAGR